MTRMIRIFDTTLRDGEQCPGASMNVEQKLSVARQLARLKVDVIEAGFAISSPGDFEAVQRISREIRGTDRLQSRPGRRQGRIDRAWEALREAERPRIHTFISTSDIHLKHQFRMTRQQAMDRAVEMVKRARTYVEDVEFSPMDASRSDPEYLYRVIEAVIGAGAGTVNIPDTVGYAVPDEFGALIRGIVEKVPNAHKAVISVHCHNDLGLAVANSLAAIVNGAGQVECTINGIGERAGNASMEEIVMALRTRKDVLKADTRIVTEEIYPASRLVSAITGMVVQPNKAIVGANAFAHESGIHQDGLLKEKSTYEIMTPESVGVVKSRLVLGETLRPSRLPGPPGEDGIPPLRRGGQQGVRAFQAPGRPEEGGLRRGSGGNRGRGGDADPGGFRPQVAVRQERDGAEADGGHRSRDPREAGRAGRVRRRAGGRRVPDDRGPHGDEEQPGVVRGERDHGRDGRAGEVTVRVHEGGRTVIGQGRTRTLSWRPPAPT